MLLNLKMSKDKRNHFAAFSVKVGIDIPVYWFDTVEQ